MTNKRILLVGVMSTLMAAQAVQVYAQKPAKKAAKTASKPKAGAAKTATAKPVPKQQNVTPTADSPAANPVQQDAAPVQETPRVAVSEGPSQAEKRQMHRDSICNYEKSRVRDSMMMYNGDARQQQVAFPAQPSLLPLLDRGFDSEFVLMNYLYQASAVKVEDWRRRQQQAEPDAFVPIVGMVTRELEKKTPLKATTTEGTLNELQDHIGRCMDVSLADSVELVQEKRYMQDAFNFYAEALKTIEKREVLAGAEDGDDDAQYKLGLWYYNGSNDMDRNYEEAVKWWQKAADRQNPHAMASLAECYELGQGVTRDSLQAVKLYDAAVAAGENELISNLEARAKRGNMFCQMYLVQCYRQGKGVDADEATAIKYYTMAADGGNADAQYALAAYYQEKEDYKNAVKFYQLAAKRGNVASMYWSGKLGMSAAQTEQEKAQAFSYLQRAAEADHLDAIYETADCYMNGRGTAKNVATACVYLKKAAPRGHVEACWQLARAYVKSTGVTQHYEQALYWFSKAVAKGHPCTMKDELQDEPGFILYLNGVKSFMSDRNFEEAIRQFKELEKMGNAMGTVMQAAVLSADSNPKRNDKKALKMLEKIATAQPLAYHYMGKIYETGENKNTELAVKYYSLAADAQYAPSLCRMGDYYYEGNDVVDKNPNQAIKYFRRAYEQGRMSTKAARRLASFYEKGASGVPADPQKAEELNKLDTKDAVQDMLLQL